MFGSIGKQDEEDNGITSEIAKADFNIKNGRLVGF